MMLYRLYVLYSAEMFVLLNFFYMKHDKNMQQQRCVEDFRTFITPEWKWCQKKGWKRYVVEVM
jgi:hypothetical protein